LDELGVTQEKHILDILLFDPRQKGVQILNRFLLEVLLFEMVASGIFLNHTAVTLC
jgi:hypothetical protein